MTRRCGTFAFATTFALLAAAFVTASDGRAQTAAPPDKIVVAPMTPSPVAWTAYYIAQPLGYYAAENLAVDIIRNPPRGSQVAGLLTGQFAFGGLSSVNNMPDKDTLGHLRWFVNHEMFPFSVYVLDSSPVKSVKELAGKTIAMRSANDEPAVKIMMAGGAIEPGSYKMLATGPGLPGGVALQRGSAEAFVGTAVDEMEIEGGGIKLRRVDLGSAAGLYNGGLMATTETLKNKRDLAVRFGRAVTKAYIWVNENPDAALDLLAKIVPEAVQDRDGAKRILLAVNASNRQAYDAKFIADPAIYERQIKLEHEVGILSKTFPAQEVFTNDLMKDIWNFDVEKVRAQARAGKY